MLSRKTATRRKRLNVAGGMKQKVTAWSKIDWSFGTRTSVDELIGLQLSSIHVRLRRRLAYLRMVPQQTLERGMDLPEQRPRVPVELDAVFGQSLQGFRCVRSEFCQIGL